MNCKWSRLEFLRSARFDDLQIFPRSFLQHNAPRGRRKPNFEVQQSPRPIPTFRLSSIPFPDDKCMKAMGLERGDGENGAAIEDEGGLEHEIINSW